MLAGLPVGSALPGGRNLLQNRSFYLFWGLRWCLLAFRLAAPCLEKNLLQNRSFYLFWGLR